MSKTVTAALPLPSSPSWSVLSGAVCVSLAVNACFHAAQPKSEKAELDDDDKAFQQKKREEAAALKKLKEVAGAKGGFAKTSVTGKKK